MQEYKKYLVASSLMLCGLLAACNSGGLSAKQRTEAEGALKALQKISAATEVGVNFQQYGTLVIDAKAQTNEAVGVLPDGELKQELNSAMDGYVDALSIWSSRIKSSDSEYSNIATISEPGKSLIPKYNLPTVPVGSVRGIRATQAQQLVWSFAKSHLEKAVSLMN